MREERFVHGAWEVELILPRAADELIDEAEFAADERLPYWAELWPSGRALTRHLLDAGGALHGVRVLELGCGVGLPSLAAAHLGAEVTATDWYPEALRFTRANAARNGLDVRTAVLDWREPPAGERYDLVLAADVLYEQRNAGLLAELLPRVTAPGGRVLLADPGRIYAAEFRQLLEAGGWTVEEIDVRREPSAPTAHSRVRIVRAAAYSG